MLRSIRSLYEEHHKCKITDDAIVKAVKLSSIYIPYRKFPDKAIDLIDEACSTIVIENFKKKGHNARIVDVVDIENVVSLMYGIDIKHISKTEDDKINSIEASLKDEIIGQNHAVDVVVNTLKRHTCGLHDTNRPICSMLFVGPTGVGKTETVKLLAKNYYGDENHLVRFDMSEYMDSYSVSTLIGAPPGYLGYEEGGKLTTAIKNNPCSVILFDEIEKAHPDVLNLFLQMLEDGVLTDSFKRHYSLKNNIIVMTSNATGSDRKSSFGFINDYVSDLASDNKEKMSIFFRPEFMNRIDEIVHFNFLSEGDIRRICDNMLEQAISRVNIVTNKGVNIIISEDTYDKMIKEIFLNSTNYGARPIRIAIERYVIDPLTNLLLTKYIKENEEIII